jgi:uncharacterized protein CbrC (UPF0167 family)
MFATFAELGIPFPLFEGPADQAVEYCGQATCSLCGQDDDPCFLLGIGCGIILKCPSCGVPNGLDADNREDGTCRQCQAAIPFPDVGDDEIAACYGCLRAGRAALTKDTELGMISWEQAFEGVTHGPVNLPCTDFELVQRDDNWFGARLPLEMMFELLRTPTYSTIQGERWQFCCRRPMVYLGAWTRDEFSRRSTDGNGRALFDQIVQSNVPGLWEERLHDVTGVYVFRCPSCRRLTAHWDIA